MVHVAVDSGTSFNNYNLCTLIVGDVAETESTDEVFTPRTPQTPTAIATTMSPMINALTEPTVASVIGNIEEDVHV